MIRLVGTILHGNMDGFYTSANRPLPALMSAKGRVSRTHRLSRTVCNCRRDEGGPFEAGSQVQVSSHRKLLSSRAMVVSVAETSGPDHGRQG
jgi:hypothetical protein